MKRPRRRRHRYEVGVVIRIRIGDDVIVHADSSALYYSAIYGGNQNDDGWTEVIDCNGVAVEMKPVRHPL